jgi:hypothetical protein
MGVPRDQRVGLDAQSERVHPHEGHHAVEGLHQDERDPDRLRGAHASRLQ